MRPRKITEHEPSDILYVMKQGRDGMCVNQQATKGDPREGQYLFKNGRIYCPKKRGEMVFIRYQSIFHEQI